jgi:hypothetical protein
VSAVRPLVLERIGHVPGELLRSRDLRDQVAADAELLWWHQRALHDAAGVVAGLQISTDKGGMVTVLPGLAFDPRGREVLLAERAGILLPAAGAPPSALVLRRCDGRPPRLEWVPLTRLGRCDGVPLARFDPAVDLVARPWEVRARPTARPRFAAGATLPGATAWEPWLALQRSRRGIAIQVYVDTRAAGFTGRPCYFAWLQWPRAGDADAQLAHHGYGLQHLDGESVDGFTFRVVLRKPFSFAVAAVELTLDRLELSGGLTTFARAQRLSVAWVGLDCDAGGAA